MSYFKVAANGAAAIVSKTVIVAEKYIDYEQVIRIIKVQEEEEEKKRNPPLMPTPAVVSVQAPTAMLTSTNNISIPPIPNNRYIGDYPYSAMFEYTKPPYSGVHYSKKLYDETPFPNLEKPPKSPGSNIYRYRMAIPLAKLKEQIQRDFKLKDNIVNRYRE
ncbi:hypothetical protein WR25_13131 [Diploscapter pachys]|uniref:Uncharacterized protein n=1 Tax=Diploscapter pachys TaxID=2018661 RepID=A0A2A2LPV1_9BILA|nr:hypothetical protein WR25_13131 [Diploscapter pachys]